MAKNNIKIIESLLFRPKAAPNIKEWMESMAQARIAKAGCSLSWC